MFWKLLDDVRAGKYGLITSPDQGLEPEEQPDRGSAAAEPTAAPATTSKSDEELPDHLIEEIEDCEDEKDSEEGRAAMLARTRDSRHGRQRLPGAGKGDGVR